MANNLQCLSAILISLIMGSSSAMAFDNYKEFRRDRWDFELGTNFFYSEANYETFGEGTTNLTSGNHYQLLNLDFSTRYIPSKTWSVFAMGSLGSAESKTSVATRTNTSFTQVIGGFDFMMYDGFVQLVPEVGVLIPLQEINGTGDSALNSEGAFETWARVTAQKDFGTTRLYGWVGYDYRADGRSSLVPWGGGLQFKGNSFRLGGEVIGSQTITDDKDKKTKYVRVAYLQTVNAGSYRFYSVNPTLIDTMLYATWNMDPQWSFQLNGGATVAGENQAAGYHVGGFIRYSFDMTDGYRQEQFIPTSTPAPRAAPARTTTVPVGRSNMYDRTESEISAPRQVRPAAKVQKPKPKPAPEINIQNELDKTEFEVELKRGGH